MNYKREKKQVHKYYTCDEKSFQLEDTILANNNNIKLKIKTVN